MKNGGEEETELIGPREAGEREGVHVWLLYVPLSLITAAALRVTGATVFSFTHTITAGDLGGWRRWDVWVVEVGCVGGGGGMISG